MPVFGLIVAGPYDEAVLKILLKRLRPDVTSIDARLCGNDARVVTTYGQRANDLRYASAGRPVEKALVVMDTHRLTQARAMQRLQASYVPRNYPFPVEFAVIVPELEAWLLSDHNALTSLSNERGRHVAYPPLNHPPEQISDPKQRLEELLGDAGVSYTEAAASRLAELIDLEQIEALCPSFTLFMRAAMHC